MKNKFLRTAAVLALCAVVSAGFLSGTTMARYRTGADITAGARVAAFDVNWEQRGTQVGVSNGAVIIRPNNWTNNIPIWWTMRNNSDVAVRVDNDGVDIMILRPVNALGEFLPGYWNVGTRQYLRNFPISPFTNAVQASRNPTPHNIVLPDGVSEFRVYMQGYTTGPGVPTGATGTWAGNNVTFGVGHNHSINMLTHPYWRTYRANADIRIVQVD